MDVKQECEVNVSAYAKSNMHISAELVTTNDELKRWPHLRDVQIVSLDNAKLHILIGQDMPDRLMPKRVKSGSAGELYATKTLLGWALNGPLKPSAKRSDNQIENYFVQSEDAVLNDLVERFWRLHSVCVSDERVMSQVDERVTKLWDTSVERENGHYVLSIPFNDDIIVHATGLNVAKKRLQLLKGRFGRDPCLKVKYVGVMKELLEKGFAEKVPNGQVGAMQRVHYLPLCDTV